MRLFIAVDVPEAIKQKVGSVVGELATAARRERADIKWVETDNLHLTLKFLGECPDEKLAEIVAGLDQAVSGASSFPLTLGGLGSFPERGAPRVIWVGLLEGPEPLAHLAEQVEKRLEPLGFPREDRPFSAHLTLGRVRAARNPAKLRALVEMTKIESLGQMEVSAAALYQSKLSPKGPAYIPLYTAAFKAPSSSG